MAKIGRNFPCPCGSGRKFKRCHGVVAHIPQLPAHLVPHMLEARDRAIAHQVQRERQQGLGRPIVSIEASGYRLVAVRNRLLHSKGWRTFHDFLCDYIKIAIGVDWGNAELAKPLDQRHPILVWYHHLCMYQRTFIKDQGQVHFAPMIGAVAAYMHLAYDLYALDHNAELQDKLMAA